MKEILGHPGRAASGAPFRVSSIPADEELRGFFTNTRGMLCVAGFDGYFKRLNPAWTSTLGWPLEELQSRPFLEFVHPTDRAATRAEMEKLTTGARTIGFENRYRCQDDSYRWLQWSASSLRGREQVYAIARDITTRKGLEEEILQTSEREQERLGRELHDGLCQNLAGIAALSTTLARKLAACSLPESDDAREITRLLNDTIGHARDMARGLNPVNLEQIGIDGVLETFAANVEALFHVSCRFRCHVPVPHLGSDIGVHLFRIAQEAVNNAITHGGGSHIELSLGFRAGKGLLKIRDDGKGVSEDAVTGNGNGISTMGYRARFIGGALQLRRRPLGGTTIACVFPLPHGQQHE